MDIQHIKIDEILVIALGGRLDSQSSPELEEKVQTLLPGNSGVVFDLKDLEYISSAGLRVILMTAKLVKQSGGKLALCEFRPHIREVFEISGFLNIMTVCASRVDAEAIVKVG